jgi:hypothetical protein
VNSFRAAGAILGTLLAVAVMRPLVETFGGGAGGWLAAGLVAGAWLAAPWPLVHRATFERPGFQRPAHEPFLASIRSLAQHTAYVRLTGLFLLGRIAIDLASTMFLYYFTYWLGRPGDFEPTLGLFLIAIVGSLPMWLAISKRVEKRTLYVLGAASWIGSQLFLLAATPEWPRAWIFVGAAIGGVGYAAADMIPWSMLGEVVDEDELRSGERREGLYYGLFTFLRKLGGATAVFVALALLDLSGYVANQPPAAERDHRHRDPSPHRRGARRVRRARRVGGARLPADARAPRRDPRRARGAPARVGLVSAYDDDALVVPDGGRVRLLRHRRGWSRRALVDAVARASERATGVPTTLSLNLLGGIEETNESIPYATLCRIAAGLECEPVELVRPDDSLQA